MLRVQIIAQHGGTTSDAISGDTTHLVANATDCSKRRKPARVKEALRAKIPVVSEQYVLDLANRNGVGIRLRQRKHFGKEYVLSANSSVRPGT